MSIVEKFKAIYDEHSDAKISLVRGTLSKFGKQEAFSFGYSNNGTPFARGVVKATNLYKHDGQFKEVGYFVSFVAFGEVAESMSNLKEGDRVTLLTDRRRRKFGDKWFDEDVVLVFGGVDSDASF